MIAKEYTYIINEYFRSKYKNKEITFINKESTEPCEIKFGDRRMYKIEIWAVNFVTNKKNIVFTIQEPVLYEDNKIKKALADELLKHLWILTLNNMQEIDKYGIQ
jgi:hypothetical protein